MRHVEVANRAALQQVALATFFFFFQIFFNFQIQNLKVKKSANFICHKQMKWDWPLPCLDLTLFSHLENTRSIQHACRVLSPRLISSKLVLSCLVLFRLVSSCLVLSGLRLSCLEIDRRIFHQLLKLCKANISISVLINGFDHEGHSLLVDILSKFQHNLVQL